MSFFVYFIVLLISVGSVIFGADWLQAPMSPMAPSKYELQAAKPPPPPPVQQADIKKPETKATAATTARAEATAVAVASPAPAPAAVEPAPQPIIAEEPKPVAAAEPPKCDVTACERAYRSFTASDCTYQPSDGPRRLCTKGTPPAAASLAKPEARAQATCNIAACTDAYVSFNASDCTYQPSDGPRRLCAK